MRILILLSFLLVTFTLPITMAYAQDGGNVETLDQILNPEQYGSKKQPLTSKSMANSYYQRCAVQKSLAFDKESKTILCACMAANMSEILTVEEFKLLKVKNNAGREVRGKTIAFAFTNCMPHVIEPRIEADCLGSRHTADIVRGKETLCDCVSDKYRQYMTRNASWIFSEAQKYNPMTLNPLEHYFTSMNYESQHEHFVKQCKDQFLYNRDK